MDEDNGSLMRKSKRKCKVKEQLRWDNAAANVARPLLPSATFDEWKTELLRPLDEKEGEEIKEKPL